MFAAAGDVHHADSRHEFRAVAFLCGVSTHLGPSFQPEIWSANVICLQAHWSGVAGWPLRPLICRKLKANSSCSCNHLGTVLD